MNMLKPIEHFGNRRSCLEGCGRFVMKGKAICRKCKRRNKRRMPKVELRERKNQRNMA